MFANVIDLTENQRAALPHLVEHATITAGCKAAGIAPKTAYAWIRDSLTFREVLREQRAAVAEAALDGLKCRVDSAVATLCDLMQNGKTESVRRAAARDILDFTLRLREQQEIESRLHRLEAFIQVRHEQ